MTNLICWEINVFYFLLSVRQEDLIPFLFMYVTFLSCVQNHYLIQSFTSPYEQAVGNMATFTT